MEVSLGVDDDMARFLQDGFYSTWQSKESIHGRIQTLNLADEITVNREPRTPTMHDDMTIISAGNGPMRSQERDMDQSELCMRIF